MLTRTKMIGGAAALTLALCSAPAASAAPPDTVIVSGPSGLIDVSAASFAFDAGQADARFQCSLDGLSFAECSSPRDYSNLAQGPHVFLVRAIVGQEVDPLPAQRYFTVDTIPPDTMITGGPSGLVATDEATFALTSNELDVTFQCALDSAPATPCDPAYSLRLGQGPHTVAVAAVDAVGHVDASPATRSWTVDTVAPQTTILLGPPAISTIAQAAFKVAASETPASFACTRDGSPFDCGAQPQLHDLQDGAHVLEVEAIDAAGNHDPSPATHAWISDTIAPDVWWTVGPKPKRTVGPWKPPAFVLDTNVGIHWGGTDAGAGLGPWTIGWGPSTSYSVGVHAGGGPFNWLTTQATSHVVKVNPGGDLCATVMNTDLAGHLKDNDDGLCSEVPWGVGSLAKKTSGWKLKTGAGYFLGKYLSSSMYGAYLYKLLPAYTESGRIALIATRCPGCGSVTVSLGSPTGPVIWPKKILLTSRHTHKRQLIPIYWNQDAPLKFHSVTIRVTSSGKPVRIEGLAVDHWPEGAFIGLVGN